MPKPDVALMIHMTIMCWPVNGSVTFVVIVSCVLQLLLKPLLKHALECLVYHMPNDTSNSPTASRKKHKIILGSLRRHTFYEPAFLIWTSVLTHMLHIGKPVKLV